MEERFIFDAEKLSRAWTNGNEIKRETNIVESRSFRLNFKNFSFDVSTPSCMMGTTTTRDEQSSLIVAHNETSFFSIRLAFLVYTRYTHFPRVKKRRDRKRTERLKKERKNAASSSAAERKIANILRHGRHRAEDELWLVVCVFWRTTTPSELFIPAEDEIRQQWKATLPRSARF